MVALNPSYIASDDIFLELHQRPMFLELHQHPRVGDVLRICLLNNSVSPRDEMPQPLPLLLQSIAGAGVESVKGEG